ncbi:putative retrotransposon hot spot protein 4 (RHS4) [Trypanosoma vivax]|nr:putative retrotransposon hot spot protein 4 (RHS4) [Trypanosoma vivax]KAH8615914.1 putative retrotransposon hot spot protein 4 (RHS4) [Trypanosoma vivax]KAH8615918.1 putative retrotransposon hot spot protein 4 (RHS4) [Trypanosoma vivax]KAH8615936.1 putative retrotransposon hot spot protein 4 (RHS4) [Trypanosoma vivax]KAH8615939.1 putative retrotransposon hot spot protein 4 (RHS4) [Trypanosoma vivax]
MDDVIREPELYIPDADMRTRVLNLPECQTCALVCKVVPQLERNGITSVLQWGGAGNAVARHAVRNAVADDGLWNTTRCLLDAAFSAAKDADARERAERMVEKISRRVEKERVERATIGDEMRRESLMITMERQDDLTKIRTEILIRELIKSKRIGDRELRELRERQSNVKCCVSLL